MEQRAESNPSSPTPSSNISRLGRQITRSILPALRNLVRPNRSSSSSRTRRQSIDSSSNSIANNESPLNLSSAVPALPDVPPLAPSLSSPVLDTEGWFSDEPAELNTSNTNIDAEPSTTSANTDSSSTDTAAVSSSSSLENERWFEDVPVFQGNTTDFLPPLHRLPALLRRAASRQTRSEIPLLPSSSSTDDNEHMEVDGENTIQTEPAGNGTGEGGRQRYRLVVYFEERSQEDQTATARYVAVIVGRLDELQFLLTNANNPERGFTDILDHLFNAYKPKGTPPASQSSIDTLGSCSVSEEGQRCAICLENFEVGYKATELPCKHSFHGDECVKHWLTMHNSCPVCRYELPVDDVEYEADRKKRMVERGIEHDEFHHEEVTLTASSVVEHKEDHSHHSSNNSDDSLWNGSADM